MMNKKYKLEQLLPVIEEALNSGKDFTLPVTGTSMLPLLVQKRDTVTIKKAGLPLKKGDLPLYRRHDGSFVLHRVVDVRGNMYVMCGDNQFEREYPVSDSQIIGIVSKITRKGKTFEVDNGLYRVYTGSWTALMPVRYPIRRLKVRVSSALKKADSSPPQQCGDTVQQLCCEELYLTALVKSVLNGEPAPPVPQELDAGRLYAMACAHRVAGMCANAVKGLKQLPEETADGFKRELFKNITRSLNQERELKKICTALEGEHVAYCVLKGEALSALYPDKDMRFSLDCDIYVDARDTERAAACITALGYERPLSDGAKDITFIKKPFMTVELHFALSYQTDMTHESLNELEKRLVPSADNPLRLTMTDEDLYIYTLAHTAHHFLTAGTGLRSVADDYLMRKKLLPRCNGELIREQLKKARLDGFAEQFAVLGDYWFGSGTVKPVEGLEQYVMRSGVYGTPGEYYINATVSSGVPGGSRSGYILRRIFPSRTDMAAQYPRLKSCAALLPYYWVLRCTKALVNPGRYAGEASQVASVDENKRRQREQMLKKMF